jgi:hypothetical protein
MFNISIDEDGGKADGEDFFDFRSFIAFGLRHEVFILDDV